MVSVRCVNLAQPRANSLIRNVVPPPVPSLVRVFRAARRKTAARPFSRGGVCQNCSATRR
jgi:hypothetical protein